MSLFEGSGVALATPFKDGKVDYISLKNLIEYQIANETDAIIICGTTGESSTLTYEEQSECIRKCVEFVKGRVKVIAGTGSNCTKSAIKLSKQACLDGVDGLLIVTPYYNKVTQNGLIKYYSAIAESVDKPIIMYNVPSRTGVNILPETAIKISKKNKNVVGIKEASGNISQVAYLSYLKQKEDIELDIYSGNDDQVLAILALGGSGVISVNANIIPRDIHNMCLSFKKGDLEKSLLLQHKAILYAKVLFSEVNPIPVKRALYELGLISTPDVREPLTDLEEKHVKDLRKVLFKNIV